MGGTSVAPPGLLFILLRYLGLTPQANHLPPLCGSWLECDSAGPQTGCAKFRIPNSEFRIRITMSAPSPTQGRDRG